MPRYLIQSSFAPADFLSDRGLNVHQHPDTSPCLVVFVHGLGGSGYGTWDNYPRFVFEAGHDVALFDYPSFHRRLKHLKAPEPAISASLLRQELQILNQYQHIMLVGHSMGGLVAGFAAEEYFDLHRLRAASSVLPLAGLLALRT